MARVEVTTPFPFFYGLDGQPLDAGYVYIGVENLDPITNPVSVYWDSELLIPAAQPIRTINGYPSLSGTPSRFFADGGYSILVKDHFGRTVFSAPRATSLASDLANPSDIGLGDALVTVKQPFTGTVATTQHEFNSREIHVKDWGGSASATQAENVASFQAAYDYMNAQGGGVLNIGDERYEFDANITVYPKTKTKGKGKKSILSFNGGVDGVLMPVHLNSSTAVDIAFEDLAIVATGAGGVGAGITNVGGSYLWVRRCYIHNWKYGIILDQTEHAHIKYNEIVCGGPAATNGAGIWIANGNYTPGTDPNFTNRIDISENQINSQVGALAGIIDDGGTDHSYVDNNFQGGGIRAAGTYALKVSANEFEGASAVGDLTLTDTLSTGGYIGSNLAFEVDTNLMIGTGGTAAYNLGIGGAKNGRVVSNYFGQNPALIKFLDGAANSTVDVLFENNSKLITGPGKTAAPFFTGLAADFARNQIRQTACTYCTGTAIVGANTMTPASMEFITAGTSLFVSNADGTNAELVTVTAVTGATFTATFASTKAADFVIYGITPYDKQGADFTPVLEGTTSAGVGTYSVQIGRVTKIGNVRYFTAALTWSAHTGTGNMKIAGFPFTTLNNNANMTWPLNVLQSNLAYTAGKQIGAGMGPNASSVTLYQMDPAGGAVALIPMDTAGTVYVSGFVEVAG